MQVHGPESFSCSPYDLKRRAGHYGATRLRTIDSPKRASASRIPTARPVSGRATTAEAVMMRRDYGAFWEGVESGNDFDPFDDRLASTSMRMPRRAGPGPGRRGWSSMARLATGLPCRMARGFRPARRSLGTAFHRRDHTADGPLATCCVALQTFFLTSFLECHPPTETKVERGRGARAEPGGTNS